MLRLSAIFTLIWLLSWTSYSSAQPEYLQTQDINTILQQILNQHLDKKEITASILQHSFKVYIDQFDPERIYLLQAEAEPFLKISSEKLNSTLSAFKQGNFKEYEELNNVIAKAISRARKIRLELENQKIAELFQLNEDSPNGGYEEWRDPDLMKFFAKNDTELAQRIQNELQQFVIGQKKRYGNAYVDNRREQTIKILERNFQQHENGYLYVNEKNEPMSVAEKQNDFVMHILKALASSLDAHTTVLNPKEAQDMRIRLEKEVQGIGIGLRQTADGKIFISHIVEGGPAAKSRQIQINDQLVEVDNLSVQGLELSRVMEMVRGKKGSKVTLILNRGQAENQYGKTFPVILTREEIAINEERAESWFETFGTGIIGVIKLDSFYQGDNGVTSENDVRNAIKRLDRQGNLRGLILDLRENSGGFLSQAVKVASLFISNGIVVISKYFNGEEHFYRDVDGRKAYDGPFIILTSKATASAAEIVAQALQDYGVALIVGDKHTYGKGTIQSQTITQQGKPAYFKVTVGTYYTVSGKTPQIQGVKANIEVPGPFLYENIGEEYLDFPIKPDAIAPSYEDRLTDITPNLKPWYMHYYLPTLQKKKTFWFDNLALLQKNSSYRIAHNKNYQAFLKNHTEKNSGYGREDLQLAEAINIMKDMIILQSQQK